MHNFGTDLRGFEGGGIRVSETLMPRGLQLGEHAHEAGQICFVLDGAYREQLGSVERVLRAGMMHVRAPGQPHANRFSGDGDTLTLLISIDASRWVRSALAQPVRMLADVAAEMRREMRRGDDAARAALEGLTMLTMARVARIVPGEPEWVAGAASLVERRFAESLSLAEVARQTGVSRGTLAIAFRRYRGTSVGEAIRAARVAHAKTLMMTKMPLAEIAVAAGFHDQAHLTRAFRAATGMPPGAYRYASKSSK
jgi:transcriptional regulator GlxA family with amidase domain